MSKLVSKKSQILDKEVAPPRLINRSGELVYRFGPFYLDTSERLLIKGGTPVQLTPKAFDILLLLVKEHSRLVGKGRLMDTIWPEIFVEEKTLTQNIFTLRKALGLDPAGQQYIETIPKHGYRFRADVEIVSRQDHNGAEQKAQAEIPAAVEAHAKGLEAAQFSAPLAGTRPLRRTVNRRLLVLASLLAAAFIVASVVAGEFYFHGRSKLADSAFRKIKIARLTDDGNIDALTLSPDGKYVAYAAIRGDLQSLFIRQVETTSAVEVVPPAPVSYRGITFSRDGAWLYYVTVEKDSFVGTLYRVPLLGGTSQKVLPESVGSRVEFSQDGKQIAFVHWVDRTHTALIIANLDGTDRRQLATLDYEEGFSVNGPTWSPDGKTILVPTQSYNGKQPFASVVAINAQDGRTQTLLGNRWNWIGQMTWLADGSGVVLTAWDSHSDVMSDQIWLMTFPAGETRRLTNDVNGYLGVSVSADARVIAASESMPAKNFWFAPGGDWAQARKITNGTGELYSERFGLAWTPDGHIVYSSRQSGNPDIWTMEANGTGQKQLTFDTGADLQPAVSPDGQYIVFVSSRTGRHQLWRMDIDGNHPLMLASTEGVQFPGISPDGQWAVYEGNAQGKTVIWRVPLSGGIPIQLTQDTARCPVISPDGNSIACFLPNDAPGPAKLSLISATDGHIIEQFETPVQRSAPALRWSPDGLSLTYIVTRQGVSNIWRQPVDGGEAKALTDWKADLIYRFDWSKDGQLLCERGTTASDIILIRDAGNE